MRLLILYGSQTGNAEGIAERIAREAFRRGAEYHILPMNQTTPMQLAKERYVVFICSTSGDGQAPTNMEIFWRALLHRDLSQGLLDGLWCAVFGLGDSSYEKFNYAGKRLFRRLEQLGANFICERADGDEQHPLGPEGALLPWLNALWTFLEGQSDLHLHPAQGGLLPPKIRLEPVEGIEGVNKEQIQQQEDHPTGGKDQAHYFRATLKEKKRITAPEHFQDVRHVIFSLDRPYAYQPGDVAILKPSNPPSLVSSLLLHLGWTEGPMRIHVSRPDARLPSTLSSSNSIITLRELLTEHLDINAPPKPYFFEICSYHTEEKAKLHREKLEELSMGIGADLYLDYCWRPKRTPYEVLCDFPSIKHIPVDYIFDLFPPLQPREYSIASASVRHPAEVHLTAALVLYRTILATPRKGLCSQWLEGLSEKAKVTLGIRPGQWRYPTDPSIPIVLMCAGTGIAPMRALIHHYTHPSSSICPPLYLFFGCRYLTKDYHYHEEWTSLQAQGYPLRVFAKGSREGEDRGQSRSYLDSILLQHAELIGRLLGEGAFFYLAGNSRLPKQVKRALDEIAADETLSEKLIRQGRFHIEAWS